MDIKMGIKKVTSREDLTREEMIDVMNEIMEGKATDAQIAGFLIALKMKGETIEEITGAATVMREKSLKIYPEKEILLDTCGTGGDNLGTINISTAVAFVAAAAGISVAKHGNRSVSSKSGSADVLEALGVNLSITPEKVEESIKKVGIGFLFALTHHKSMKYAIGPRRQLGVRTIFNVLGPLTNPANAEYQLMGVYSKDLVEPIANVLNNLGIKRAMVVHGEDGLDEITTTGKTFVGEVNNGEVKTYSINIEDYFEKNSVEDLKGEDAKYNGEVIKNILSGKEKGAKRNIIIINSAAVLFITGLVNDLKSGIKKAEEILDSGKALNKLNEYVKFTNS
ncbi:anthranilate phosphoribosyltransferase [Haliovirga abyssi]|uniref:Anthranilate phosphoribosyltransferase n=1 Tax=Haliovirga abyssi TaxID=2996794 RepID=A0AAU9D9L9_9FUSO|nr:anthranilate phosphoribosyltransferase [Haliovirga abyssi]BDU50286.1 anthranilate phosphoribosyltransferase [Haliovirga abyssi]